MRHLFLFSNFSFESNETKNSLSLSLRIWTSQALLLSNRRDKLTLEKLGSQTAILHFIIIGVLFTRVISNECNYILGTLDRQSSS